MSDNVNERAVLNVAKADRQAALDFMQFNRLPHVNRMKYEDGFEPPKDHNEWVERQISKGKGGKATSVKTTIHDAIEEITEERDLFHKLNNGMTIISDSIFKKE